MNTIKSIKLYDLDLNLNNHTKADENFTITVNYLLNLASRAYQLFESSKLEQKRQLINFLLSNLRLKGKTLLYEVNKPFDAILNANKCSNWLPGLDNIENKLDYSLGENK